MYRFPAIHLRKSSFAIVSAMAIRGWGIFKHHSSGDATGSDHMHARYLFEPIAVETLGVNNTSACHLLNDLRKRMTVNSGEARETGFLYQRISVLIQRYNAVLLHDGLPDYSTD